MKLVLDTNTLISGSLWQGPAAQILEAAALGKAVLVSSPELLAEFAEVASRPKFAARIIARGTTPDDLARRLADKSIIVSPAVLALPPELRDPKDLHVLACGVAARPDAIVTGDEDLLVVTGDEDLLVLKVFQGIPILNAREALERLERSGR